MNISSIINDTPPNKNIVENVNGLTGIKPSSVLDALTPLKNGVLKRRCIINLVVRLVDILRRDSMNYLNNYKCEGQLDIFEYEKLKGMTQTERIVDYINNHGSISTIEAFNVLGVTRLASRIHDLICDGYAIEKQIVCAKNRFGESIHYTRYSIKEG